MESASSLRGSTVYILLLKQRLWGSSFPALLIQLQKTSNIRRGFAKQPSGLHFRAAVTLHGTMGEEGTGPTLLSRTHSRMKEKMGKRREHRGPNNPT